MSDISIPGVSSKYKSEETIQKLVKAESFKLDVMKKDMDKFDLQKSSWLGVNKAMADLRASVRVLYSFENPFNERTATSSAPDVITGTATRQAIEGTTHVEVLQLASPDRFISKEFAKNQQVPEGLYEFTVGPDKVSLRYHGGSVQDFAENLTKRAGGVLKASVVKTTPDSQVLVIEGAKSGASNALLFKQDSIKLGESLGLIQRSPSAGFVFSDTDGKQLTLKPNQNASLDLPAGFSFDPAMELEIKTKLIRNPEEAWSPPPVPLGPKLPPGPEAALKDVRIHDTTTEFPELPAIPVQKPPAEVQDANILFSKSAGTEKLLAPVKDSNDFITTRYPLKELSSLDGIVIKNNNTFKILTVVDAKIVDPRARDDYKPVNPAATAQDAKLRIDGVVMTRTTNVVDDIIPGVTLTLQSVGTKPVNIKVDPDRKQVKDKIIEWVAKYNAVVREINVLTARSDDVAVVDDLDFLSADEKTAYKKKLGLYQGDSTLNMARSRLSTIQSNAYQTRDAKLLSVLGQIGISTNAAGAGVAGSIQTSNLRGYLEINEKQLDKALDDHFFAIKDLFGSDTNGDLLVDSGVGYQMDTFLQSYVQSGGLITNRTNTIDSQVVAKKKEIDNYQAYLKRYESDLKSKYGQMESNLNQIESNSQGLKRLDNNRN